MESNSNSTMASKQVDSDSEQPSQPNTTPSKPINSSASITVLDDSTSIVREGSAQILFAAGNAVFYNPVQQFNRDLSTLGIRAWASIYGKEKREKRERKSENKRRNNKRVKVEEGEDVKSVTAEDTKVTTEDANPEKDTKLTTEDTNSKPKPFINIIEALSASGLRAIRYASEIPGIRRVYANDFSPSAVESIRKNAEFCKVDKIVVPNQGDANMFMYSCIASPFSSKNKQNAESSKSESTTTASPGFDSEPIHVIDLDPYGSASPFIDAAVRAVTDSGLLLITCTDASVLAGNGYPEKCFSLYGGHTLYADGRHESALRLVLHMVATTAAKYGLVIEPQLSLSIDFYVRLFVRVRKSAASVKFNASKTVTVFHCQGCDSVNVQPLGRVTYKETKSGKGESVPKFGYAKIKSGNGDECEHCGNGLVMAGPMWGGPLHNHEFINEVLKLQDELSKSQSEESKDTKESEEKKETKETDPKETNQTSIYGTLPRIKGMVSAALQELQSPSSLFYFHPQSLSSKLKTASPPHRAFVSAICNAGYECSYTHAMAGAIKTNAPYGLLWDILKAWIIKENEGKEGGEGKENGEGEGKSEKKGPNNKVGSPGYQIMKNPIPK